MAAATSVWGREEGGGGSRRREGGGRREEERSLGDRGGGRRGGSLGAERSGAGPAPSLRLGAGAWFRPPLPALGGGGASKVGWVELPDVPKGGMLEKDPIKTFSYTDPPTQERSPRELFSTDEFPVRLEPSPLPRSPRRHIPTRV